jgi:hypothetical protein
MNERKAYSFVNDLMCIHVQVIRTSELKHVTGTKPLLKIYNYLNSPTFTYVLASTKN